MSTEQQSAAEHEILNAYDPRAFTDALLRPTDDMDVALALSGSRRR